MSTLNDAERRVLLKLARSVLVARLTGSSVERPEAVSPALSQKQGCFVTLHKHGQLRGCIGTIEPVTTLLAGVENNAVNAAFKDPRFSPLKSEELPEIEIEISVLSVPEPLLYNDAEELKSGLVPGVHGVILSGGGRRATFLPQVWTQLPDKEAFLAHLCRKAGLAGNAWKSGSLEIQTYQAEYFSE